MKLILPLLFVLASALAPAQHVQLLKDLASAESDYRDAQEAWSRNDPTLEGDLFKGDPADIRRRIRKSATLRDEMMQRKSTYLAFVVRQFDELQAKLVPATSTLPTDALRQEINREQTRLLEDQSRIDTQLREMPTGDQNALVRSAMRAQVEAITRMRSIMTERVTSIDRIANGQQEAQGTTKVLEEKLAELGELWRAELTRTEKSRALWARYFHSMDTAVAQRMLPAPRVRLEGKWRYQSKKGAWSGTGEPGSVSMELKASGDQIEGSYAADLPPAAGAPRVSFRLSLKGTTSATGETVLQWVSRKPEATGQILVRLTPEGKLVVERTVTSGGAVPAGTEVLVRR
ncbi:MAG: hypothetical protein SGI92_25255 [Bryobacteraceae bacterium]|nr:hypothetical protein [Bryobacteraceae bacterium]